MVEANVVRDASGAPRIEDRPSYKVRRALVTASEVIEGPEDWPDSYFPIIPVIGEKMKIEKKTVHHGVIRFAKPVQRIYNYNVSADLEVTALQPKTPYIGTETNFKKYRRQADGSMLKVFRDVTSGSYDVSIQMGPSYATKREEARDGMQTFMQGNPNVAPLIGDLYTKAQDWPMAEEIGELLEMLLPESIRQMKAQKEGNLCHRACSRLRRALNSRKP